MQVFNMTQLLRAVIGKPVTVNLYGAHLFVSKKQLKQWAVIYFSNFPDKPLHVANFRLSFYVHP